MKHSNFKTNVHNLVLAAMFLALALVLPFLTGQIPQIGGMLLPMHLAAHAPARVPLRPDLRLAVWRGGGIRGPADADGALRNAAAGGCCGHGL